MISLFRKALLERNKKNLMHYYKCFRAEWTVELPVGNQQRLGTLLCVADLVLITLHSNARIKRVYALSNKNKMEARACDRLGIYGCLASIIHISSKSRSTRLKRNASPIILTRKFWLIRAITVIHDIRVLTYIQKKLFAVNEDWKMCQPSVQKHFARNWKFYLRSNL